MCNQKYAFLQFLWKGSCLYWLMFVSGVSLCRSSGSSGSYEVAPAVDTSLGKIIGSNVKIKGVLVHQFLGVPYAKVPTGELRFKKPEPVEAWSQPLYARWQPRACIQYTENPFPWYDDQPWKSEDCLYLNIWVPSKRGSKSEKKAVLYWIFGGGFFIGSIRQKIYAGEALSALGDIIVVTVSYRLGSLGFLYSGSNDAPGNVGLWDILAGLQWVNDHIGAFGGDVSRITVAGTSAGSITTGLLAVSPLAQGLFTRQIMMSGSPAYTMADNNDQSSVKSQEVAELVKCSNDTFTLKDNPEDVVRCLRGVDAMELIQAESSLIPHSSRSFLPKYGDEILPNNPRQEIMSRNFRNKENVFIGNIKDEGSFQITTSNPDLFGFFGEKNPQINKTLGKSMLRKIFKAFADTEALVEHYLPDSILEDDYDIVRSQMYSATGDYTLICPTVFTAEKFSENGNKVYFYLWSHRPSTTPWAPWMGTAHYSEVQFLFGLPIKDPKRYEDNEVRLSMDIIHKWSNFVKHGKPTEQWPLYSRENPIFLTLNTKSEESGMGPHKQNCDFFRPYFGF